MASPFHHDVRGDAEGKGVDDEGTAAGVSAVKFSLGQCLAVLEGHLSNVLYL